MAHCTFTHKNCWISITKATLHSIWHCEPLYISENVVPLLRVPLESHLLRNKSEIKRMEVLPLTNIWSEKYDFNPENTLHLNKWFVSSRQRPDHLMVPQ